MARTFLPASGNETSGTQIDFAIARGRIADGVAKQAKCFEASFVPHSGCRHLPLQPHILRPQPSRDSLPRGSGQKIQEVRDMLRNTPLVQIFGSRVRRRMQGPDSQKEIDDDVLLQERRYSCRTTTAQPGLPSNSWLQVLRMTFG